MIVALQCVQWGRLEAGVLAHMSLEYLETMKVDPAEAASWRKQWFEIFE